MPQKFLPYTSNAVFVHPNGQLTHEGRALLNTVIDMLTNLTLRGTRANQPTATKVYPGTLYYVTDENRIERSSGTAWELYQN